MSHDDTLMEGADSSYIQQTQRLSLGDNALNPTHTVSTIQAQPDSPPYCPTLLDDFDLEDDILIGSTLKTLPVIHHYPLMSNGYQDKDVMKYKYSNFARPILSGGGMPPIPHYTIRFWIEFKSESGEDIPEENRPNLAENRSHRTEHTKFLLKTLVAKQIIIEDEKDALSLYYGSTSGRSHLAEGVRNTKSDSESRLYLDVKFGFWSEKIVDELIKPGCLATNKTSMIFLGKDIGIGPIAHPSYVIAECNVPERFDNSITNQDLPSFKHFVKLAEKSFMQHKERTKSELEIVAWGGFFDAGKISLDWDYRLFAIFKVPVRTEDLSMSSNPADFREDIKRFPPYTIFDKKVARNNYTFRRGCSECKNDAVTIHKDSEHLCTKCDIVGHVQAQCPRIIAQRQKRAWQDEEPVTFATKINPRDMTAYQKALDVDPARLRFLQHAKNQKTKRRRLMEAGEEEEEL